jgi:hypothetical protein
LFLIGLLPIVFTSKSFYPSIIGFSSREIKQIIATIIPDFSIPKITPIQPEKIDLDQCDEIPSGYGIPGFKPGIDKNQVFQMFGTPAKIETGYWPNTQAVFYHLIPNRVSLGFLFDKKSGKLRQTEAAFSQEVELKTILITFNSMSGCRLNSTLESGLKMVYNRKDNDYSFAIDSLKGVVERQQSDRIYIGIWEADLH